MIFVISTMALGQTAQATPDCSNIIKDCNIALDACDKTIAARDATISKYTAALDDCNKSNQALRMDLGKVEEGRDAWYRQPVVDGLIGALVGIIAYAYLTKK